MNFVKTTIRCQVDLNEIAIPFKTLAGKDPAFWSGSGVRFEFLFTRGGAIISVDNFSFAALTVLAVSRTGAAFMTATVDSLDNTVDVTSWADGSKQHLVVEFLGAEAALPIPDAAISQEYFLVLSGATNDDSADPDTFAWSKLIAYRPGVPIGTAPVQAGNLVPANSNYNGAGHFTINGITAGRALRFGKAANDTSVTNGTQTVTVADQVFFTQGTSITLNGSAGQPVTAVIWNAAYFTADEVQALIASMLSEAGVTDIVGEQAIAAAQDGLPLVTVDLTAHALGGSPTQIEAWLKSPSQDADVISLVVIDDWDNTAFKVRLSALPEINGYQIAYRLSP